MRTLTKPLERVAEEFAAVRRELAQVAGDGGVRSRVALLERGQRARVVRERTMESAESSRSLHGWDLPGRNLDVLPQRQGEPIVLKQRRSDAAKAFHALASLCIDDAHAANGTAPPHSKPRRRLFQRAR